VTKRRYKTVETLPVATAHGKVRRYDQALRWYERLVATGALNDAIAKRARQRQAEQMPSAKH